MFSSQYRTASQTPYTSIAPKTAPVLLDSHIEIADGQVQHLWYQLQTAQGIRYRAVSLAQLQYLPQDTKDDPNLLTKQWEAIRGFYSAGIDFIYCASGMFDPLHLGIVQFYGAAAWGYTLGEAISQAKMNAVAVNATLANFEQVRMAQANANYVTWLLDFINSRSDILALLGHPDPRQETKGLANDGLRDDDELAAQQNELLFRGLTKIRQNFAFLVTTEHIQRGELTRNLIQLAEYAGEIASRRKGNLSIGASIGIPIMGALASAYASGTSTGQAEGQSLSDGVSEGWGTSDTVSETKTVSHSVSRGVSENWARGWGESESWGEAHTDSFGISQGVSGSETRGESRAWTHSVGKAFGVSENWSESESHTVGSAVTNSSGNSWSLGGGESVSQSQGISSGTSVGASSSVGGGQSSGVTNSASQGSSANWSNGQGWSIGESNFNGQSSGVSTGQGTAASQSQSQTNSQSTNNSTSTGINASAGISGDLGFAGTGVGANASAGGSRSWTAGEALGIATSQASGLTESVNTTESTGISSGQGHSSGQNWSANQGGGQSVNTGVAQSNSTSASWSNGQSQSVSQGVSASQGHSVSSNWSVGGFSGTAVTNSESLTKGRSHGWGVSEVNSENWGEAYGQSYAQSKGWSYGETRGVADTKSHSIGRSNSWAHGYGQSANESWGEAHSIGKSHTDSHSLGRSHAQSQMQSRNTSQTAGRGFVGGLSTGIIPSLSINRSWIAEDDVAERVTDAVRGIEQIMDKASREGGFLSGVYLFLDDLPGKRAAASLVSQAFHGPAVPTPVTTLSVPSEHVASIQQHATAFLPNNAIDPTDPLSGSVFWQYGTLLPSSMLGAYTAPAIFAEGPSVVTQEKLPPVAFYPEMSGAVVLGHQVSPETGDLTSVKLQLAHKRFFHTAFCGDTGYGKSVAATRLVYETATKWQSKIGTVVLDFGAGWRQLLNAKGLEYSVDVRQLSPGGVRPLQWNPLQIGKRIDPEAQLRSFAEIFAIVTQLGEKRQAHELREDVRALYEQSGAMINDPVTLEDKIVFDRPADYVEWRLVQADEEALIGIAAGTSVTELTREQRQDLAVHRSRVVTLKALYDRTEERLNNTPTRDQVGRSVLEGILNRLNPFVKGIAGKQYAEVVDPIDLDAFDMPGRVTILEGGAQMDSYSKAFLLGWMAWHLFNNRVQKRVSEAKTLDTELQIVFEEANKILSSGIGSSSDGPSAADHTAEQFENMWRDSRKYGVRLHLITQSPSLIPAAIMSSCNNIFCSQLKNDKDRDLMVTAFARSKKGLQDVEWDRFIGRMPIARALVKLGYSMDMKDVEPVLVQPLLLDVPEPTDADIADRLGAIRL